MSTPVETQVRIPVDGVDLAGNLAVPDGRPQPAAVGAVGPRETVIEMIEDADVDWGTTGGAAEPWTEATFVDDERPPDEG